MLGGLALLLGLFSRALQSLPLSIPMVAFLAGSAVGPHGLGLLHLGSGDDPGVVLEEGTRIALAIGVMGVALALPGGYLRRSWRSLTVLLGVLMPVMMLSTAAVVHWIGGVGWLSAFIVGAILAPTDPILGRVLIEGEVARKSLPERMRHLLLAESGANDGLAYPLVMLPLLVGLGGRSWNEWLVHVVLWQVAGAVVIGILLGMLVGRLLDWAEGRQLVDRPHFLVLTVSLSLFAIGLARLLTLDGVLVVFCTGAAFAGSCRAERIVHQREVQDAINELVTIGIFALFGLIAPWPEWVSLGWGAVGTLVAVMLFRRLPWMLLIARWVPALQGWREAALAGWFGPVGVAALFYAALAAREHAGRDTWVISSLVVAASVLGFAITAPPLARRFARHAGKR